MNRSLSWFCHEDAKPANMAGPINEERENEEQNEVTVWSYKPGYKNPAIQSSDDLEQSFVCLASDGKILNRNKNIKKQIGSFTSIIEDIWNDKNVIHEAKLEGGIFTGKEQALKAIREVEKKDRAVAGVELKISQLIKDLECYKISCSKSATDVQDFKMKISYLQKYQDNIGAPTNDITADGITTKSNQGVFTSKHIETENSVEILKKKAANLEERLKSTEAIVTSAVVKLGKDAYNEISNASLIQEKDQAMVYTKMKISGLEKEIEASEKNYSQAHIEIKSLKEKIIDLENTVAKNSDSSMKYLKPKEELETLRRKYLQSENSAKFLEKEEAILETNLKLAQEVVISTTSKFEAEMESKIDEQNFLLKDAERKYKANEELGTLREEYLQSENSARFLKKEKESLEKSLKLAKESLISTTSKLEKEMESKIEEVLNNKNFLLKESESKFEDLKSEFDKLLKAQHEREKVLKAHEEERSTMTNVTKIGLEVARKQARIINERDIIISLMKSEAEELKKFMEASKSDCFRSENIVRDLKSKITELKKKYENSEIKTKITELEKKYKISEEDDLMQSYLEDGIETQITSSFTIEPKLTEQRIESNKQSLILPTKNEDSAEKGFLARISTPGRNIMRKVGRVQLKEPIADRGISKARVNPGISKARVTPLRVAHQRGRAGIGSPLPMEERNLARARSPPSGEKKGVAGRARSPLSAKERGVVSRARSPPPAEERGRSRVRSPHPAKERGGAARARSNVPAEERESAGRTRNLPPSEERGGVGRAKSPAPVEVETDSEERGTAMPPRDGGMLVRQAAIPSQDGTIPRGTGGNGRGRSSMSSIMRNATSLSNRSRSKSRHRRRDRRQEVGGPEKIKTFYLGKEENSDEAESGYARTAARGLRKNN